MDPKSFIRAFNDELLSTEAFVCLNCKNILTPPIMLIEDIGNVCFPCFEVLKCTSELGCALENAALNALLMKVYFPCPYSTEGCDDISRLDCYESHINKCGYKTVKCALSYCLWVGKKLKLMEHIRKCHQPDILVSENDSFVINLKKQNDIVKILKSTLGTFICRIQAVCDKLYVIVFAASDVTEKLYEVTVNRQKIGTKEVAHQSVVDNIESVVHFKKEIATVIDLIPSFMSRDGESNSKVTLTFRILKNKIISATLDKLSNVNSSLLTLLKCQFCERYLKPPIYQCQKGHDICIDCRSDVEKCPKCSEMYCGTRNYSAEYIAQFLRYPCDNKACSILSPLSLNHESICENRVWTCPLDWCDFSSDYYELLDHMLSKHNRKTVATNKQEFHLKSLSRDLKFSHYIILHNRLFEISYRHSHDDKFNRRVFWEVVVIGPKVPDYLFTFEVNLLLNKQRSKQAIFFSVPCVYKDDKTPNCLYLDEVVLSQFVDLNCPFSFFVGIVKNEIL